MATLYLVQEIGCGTYSIYELYRLTSLKEAPVKVRQESGLSEWPDEREFTPMQWAQQIVYEMEGETGDDVTIKQF